MKEYKEEKMQKIEKIKYSKGTKQLQTKNSMKISQKHS